MKKIVVLIVALVLVSTSLPINAESDIFSRVFETDIIYFDDHNTIEKGIISTSSSVLTLDYSTTMFRAIFIISDEKVSRIDYLDLESGNIYSKILNIKNINEKISFTSKMDLKNSLDALVEDVDTDNSFEITHLKNKDNSYKEIFTSESTIDFNKMNNIDYYGVVLNRFKSSYGQNYFDALRATINYRGHTGRVLETATSNVTKRWTINQIFTPGTALSVIALIIGFPYTSVKGLISAAIGIGQALYSISVNRVEDWNGIRYLEKNVKVNGSVTWRTFAKFETTGVLIIDIDKGSNVLWKSGTLSYYDGISHYNDNEGLIKRGIDNYINFGY